MSDPEPAPGTPKQAVKTTLAYVVAVLLGLGFLFVLWIYFARPSWAQEAFDVKRLDASDAAVRAAALDELKQSPERDAIVARVLRDAQERAGLGPRALATISELAGEFQVRYANSGLRAVVADASAPLEARKAAARSLAKTGGVADVSALGDAVKDLPDESARALVAIGGASAVNALRRGGGDDPPLEVLAALARLGDPSGLPKIVGALRSGGDAPRAAALLEWATDKKLPPDAASWEAYLRRRALAERFGDLDNDKAGEFTDETAAKLKAGDAALADDLIAILKDATWPASARDKAALALGLGDVRTPAAKETLLWACRSAHQAEREVGSVRMYAANALARVGDLSCAPTLIAMLNHDEDEDRISARRTGEGDFYPVDPCFIRALLRLGCRGAIDRAIELLAGEYRTRLHRDCLRALGEVAGGLDFGFQPDASKPERQVVILRIRAWWREAREQIPLAPKADDPGWEAFRKAIDENIATLGGFKFLYTLRAKNLLIDLAEPAFPQLVVGLGNENEHVRMGVADVFATSALRDAAKPLAERLKVETNRAVKTRILSALEICGRPFTDGRRSAPPEVADAVRGALTDRALDVRIAAARALGVVGDLTTDLPRFDAARADAANSDDAFRFAAAAAVARLAYQKELPELVKQLRSDDAALRTEAAKTLAAGGMDLRGYDADLPPEQREAAIRRMLMPGLTGGVLVPYRERK